MVGNDADSLMRLQTPRPARPLPDFSQPRFVPFPAADLVLRLSPEPFLVTKRSSLVLPASSADFFASRNDTRHAPLRGTLRYDLYGAQAGGTRGCASTGSCGSRTRSRSSPRSVWQCPAPRSLEEGAVYDVECAS